METEIKMLNDIHENPHMGQDTLRHVPEASYAGHARFPACRGGDSGRYHGRDRAVASDLGS